MPMPPAFISLEKAVGAAAEHLAIDGPKAFDHLLAALCDGAVIAWGRKPGNFPEEIPPLVWCRFHYQQTPLPFDTAMIEVATPDFLSWLMPVVADSGIALQPKANIDPPKKAEEHFELPDDDLRLRSGAPGRPTSKQLIHVEARRRAKEANDDDWPPSKAKFARQMAAWLKEKHPTMPACTAHTLENDHEFGGIYRSRRASRKPLPK